jgi:hypothetical protein
LSTPKQGLILLLSRARKNLGVVIRSLEEIRAEVDRLAAIIDAPTDLLPTYGYSRDLGYPHIEIVGILMSYVVMERGQELGRHSSIELDDILFCAFRDVTFSMASRWEPTNRIDGQDSRKLLWTKQFELPDQLNPAWVERHRQELGPLLAEVGL